MSKKDFECQNTIFDLSLNIKIGFLMSKYDIQPDSECQKKINLKQKKKIEKRKTNKEKRKGKNE